jgi:hypothetical protein
MPPIRTQVLTLALAALAACLARPAAAATPTATLTATPTITESPTLSPTATLSATYTVSPTVTISPTPPPTPTVTVTPIVIAVVSIDHNSFNPLTGASVRVLGLRPDHGGVTVHVFDLSGTLIRVVQENLGATQVPPAWDGRNESGQVVASGVYLIVVSGNKLHKRYRIAVLK